MRDPARIPAVMDALTRAWQLVPEQRFGQFVENLARGSDLDPWNAEEGQWLQAIAAFTSHHRLQDPGPQSAAVTDQAAEVTGRD